MAQIIEFRQRNGRAVQPAVAVLPVPGAAAGGSQPSQAPVRVGNTVARLARRLRVASLVVLGLCWPALRWILSLDVVLQLGRLLVQWDAPGAAAGWAVLAHFAVLTGLTCLVSTHRLPGRAEPHAL